MKEARLEKRAWGEATKPTRLDWEGGLTGCPSRDTQPTAQRRRHPASPCAPSHIPRWGRFPTGHRPEGPSRDRPRLAHPTGPRYVVHMTSTPTDKTRSPIKPYERGLRQPCERSQEDRRQPPDRPRLAPPPSSGPTAAVCCLECISGPPSLRMSTC